MADTPQVPGWTLVPVTGTWWHADQQTMRAGTYTVSLPRITSSGTPKVIIPAGVWAQGALATTPGAPSLAVSVPAADDAAIRESGWQVQIVVTMGTVVESYAVVVPEVAAGTGIDLRDYTPTTSALPQLTSAVGLGVPSGLALIDATGTQVVDANGTVLAGGGGGGGAVTSVAGRTGAVTLTASDLTDATATGRALVAAADAADARAAIGAGTSSLALGTTGSTAKAGNYVPARADISDATADGRTLMAAPALPAVDVWQGSNGTWPARPTWPGRVNWIGYPSLTSTPTGTTAGDTYMQRP